MSKYRIITNSNKYRIEKQRSFLCWSWWSILKVCYLIAGAEFIDIVEFDSHEEAQKTIEKLHKEERIERHGWKVIENVD